MNLRLADLDYIENGKDEERDAQAYGDVKEQFFNATPSMIAPT
jgi:hypothetical protein